MAKRDGGVVTFGILGIIFGLIGLLYSGFLVIMIIALKANAATLDSAATESLKAVNSVMLLSLAISALTGLMVFVSGVGLFSARNWARQWYMIAAGISLINRLAVFPMHFSQSVTTKGTVADAVTRVANQVGGIIGDLAGIAFSLVILWFFSRANIKALFQRGPSAPT